jgi:adhesin transport system membrane fusion protein
MHNSENKPVVDKPVLHNPAEDQRTLDNVIAGYGSPLWRNREKVLTVLFIIVVLWLAFAQVDRVVTAQGKVVPFNKVKIVQHLEGGIIEKVLVR